jgi:hypothetical protein
MAGSGPVPKRSDERIRRNKPEIEITKIEAVGEVEQPELGIPDPHPIVEDLWNSLAESGQTRYYEPSDWSYMRFILHFCDGLVKSSRPSGQMLATISSAMSDLLVSEGSRRRVRMEIEREAAANQVIDISKELKKRMGFTD